MQCLSRAAHNISATIRPRTFAALLGSTVLIATGTGYGTAGEKFSTECAVRDVQTLIKVEQHAEAKDLPNDQIAAAFFTMLQARAICGEQRVAEALAVYDRAFTAPITSAQK
jgi:hypothetical protein